MNKQCVYGITGGNALSTIGYTIIIMSYCILKHFVVVIRKNNVLYNTIL